MKGTGSSPGARNGEAGRHPVRIVTGLASVILTLGVLTFIVYRLDFRALGQALAGAQYGYVGLLLLTTAGVWIIGALQWRFVLGPVKRVEPVRLVAAQLIGALAHGLIPLPVGGLVRAYVVARREQVSLSAVLATTATDRLVDGFAFLGLLGVVLGFAELPPATTAVQAALRTAGWTSLALYGALGVLLVAVGTHSTRGAIVVEVAVGWVARQRARRAAEAYVQFCQGLRLPGRWRDRLLLVLCAVAKKAVIPFQVYWIARAFGLELPWTAYAFQVVVLGFLLVLASPLGIRGTYQAGMIVALGFYGVAKELALAIALVVEVVAHGAAMLLGLVFLWREGLTRDELRALSARWRRAPTEA